MYQLDHIENANTVVLHLIIQGLSCFYGHVFFCVGKNFNFQYPLHPLQNCW